MRFCELDPTAQRVLLVNPPIYDLRIPWFKYIQPTRLLRISSFYAHASVKFIDYLDNDPKQRIKKVQTKQQLIEDQHIKTWRFGLPTSNAEKRLRTLSREGWIPDQVYVECLTTFWWEGAQEAISLIRTVFPTTHITLIGAYAELADHHAQQHTLADDIGTIDWHTLANLSPDLSHYLRKPESIYISLNKGNRDSKDIVDEINNLSTNYNVRKFTFLDYNETQPRAEILTPILEEIISRKLKIRLSALGDIAFQDVLDNPKLLCLMRQAGYRHITFMDDRDRTIVPETDEALIEEAQQVGILCQKAKFRLRSDEIVASLCLGRHGENLEQRSIVATYLGHYLGSVIFWAYQPKPEELPTVPLEEQNGKLYPIRVLNNYSLKDYLAVLGLASILNAKYRTNTFDFLGDSLIARLFRESIERKAWDPPEDIKGTLNLPVRR